MALTTQKRTDSPSWATSPAAAVALQDPRAVQRQEQGQKELVEEGKGAVQEESRGERRHQPHDSRGDQDEEEAAASPGIIGTSSTKGSTELKQATENEEVDDYMYMKDDVSEEDKDEDEGDEDTTGYDDEDEDVHDYTNEGNLAIQELETNLDMDFLQLFASSTAAATAHGGV